MLPVLHPRHKLQYFKKAGWDDAWVNTAYEMVRHVFEGTYKSLPGVKPNLNKPNNVNKIAVRVQSFSINSFV
jgi:hypothetical protein